MNKLNKADAIIIGTGLFGSIIERALSFEGRSTITIDCLKENSGSRPAACLMKPSWFSSLGKGVYEPSLRILDELYGVQDLTFKVGPMKTNSVHWVPPDRILRWPHVNDKVTEVRPGVVFTASGDEYHAPLIVIAAGVWTSELRDVPGLTGQCGAAFSWINDQIDEPFIQPWAPYRQLVAFNRTPSELWVGDGTAIIQKNWTQDREEKSKERCMAAVARNTEPKALMGIRPYVQKAKPCYLHEHEPGVWVATGGAKNGTLAAGWCAHTIVEATS